MSTIYATEELLATSTMADEEEEGGETEESTGEGEVEEEDLGLEEEGESWQ